MSTTTITATAIRPSFIPKVRTTVTDKATGETGMLTHVGIEMDGSVSCCIQPQRTNPKTGHPVSTFWCVPTRLVSVETIPFPAHIPFDALGSTITDTSSGITGMAIAFLIHPNGCLHVHIQPRGTTEDGDRIRPYDVDLLCCEGEKLPKLTPAEFTAAREQRPSPAPTDGCPSLR